MIEVERATLRGLRIDPVDLASVLAQFDPVWERLTSHERQRVVRLLIERIDYAGAEGGMEILFSSEGVRRLAAEAALKARA